MDRCDSHAHSPPSWRAKQKVKSVSHVDRGPRPGRLETGSPRERRGSRRSACGSPPAYPQVLEADCQAAKFWKFEARFVLWWPCDPGLRLLCALVSLAGKRGARAVYGASRAPCNRRPELGRRHRRKRILSGAERRLRAERKAPSWSSHRGPAGSRPPARRIRGGRRRPQTFALERPSQPRVSGTTVPAVRPAPLSPLAW